jgi:TetR/AcrR family transcriptional regulator, repressor for uid operon
MARSRSEHTHEHIIRAARDAFCTLGYESTTLKEIAQRANVSRPTINYHFLSKDALYRAVEHDAVVNVLVEPAAPTERFERDGTFLGQLHAFATTLTDGKPDDRSRGEFLITSVIESARSAALQAAGSTTTASLRWYLAGMVTAAIERGDLGADTDVPAMVEFSLAALLGMGLSAPTRRRSASTGPSRPDRRHRRTA